LADNAFKLIYDEISSLISQKFSRMANDRIIFRSNPLAKDFRHDDFIRIKPISDEIITPFVSSETRKYNLEIIYYKKNILDLYDEMTSFAEDLKEKLNENRSSNEWFYLEVENIIYEAEIPDDYQEKYWGLTFTIGIKRGFIT